jgi:hypothetical protein
MPPQTITANGGLMGLGLAPRELKRAEHEARCKSHPLLHCKMIVKIPLRIPTLTVVNPTPSYIAK